LSSFTSFSFFSFFTAISPYSEDIPFDLRSRNLLPVRDYAGIQPVPSSFTDLLGPREPLLRPTNIYPSGTSYRSNIQELLASNLTFLVAYR
jgi:hypothetical protein